MFGFLVAALFAVSMGACAHRDPSAMMERIHKDDRTTNPQSASAAYPVREIQSSPPVTVECKPEPIYKAIQ